MIGKFEYDSPMRKLDVRSRLVLLGIAFPVSAFLTDFKFLPVICLLLILLIITFKVKVKHIARNAGNYCIFLFAILFLVSMILVDEPITTRLLTWIIMSTRFTIAIVSSSLLPLVTKPEEIAQALLKIGLPHSIGISVMLAFRFFPMLLSKSSTIRYSLRFRGVSLRINPLKIRQTIHNIFFYFMVVFATTVEMGTMFGETLVGRGYSLHRPITVSPELRLKPKDFVILSSAVTLIFLSYLSQSFI